MFRKTGASKLTAAFLTAALLAQTIFVIPAFASAKSNQYDRKLQLVTERLYEDKETVDAVKALDKAVAIISVSDGKTKAKSFSATTGSLSASLENASEKAKASGITPKWLKLEVVTDIEQMKYSDFTAEVMGKRSGSFRKGIAFNDYFGRVITEAELNSNWLIDYETGKLKLKEVNSFLKFIGKKQLDKIPSTLYIFDTASYFTENTAYAEGKRNGNRGWADGTGTYVTNEYSELSKIQSDGLKKFFALDISKLKLYETHIEEEAKKFYEFQHKLEQFCLALGSGYSGFDENTSNVDSETLYKEGKEIFSKYPGLFDKVFKDFEAFDSFIEQAKEKQKRSINYNVARTMLVNKELLPCVKYILANGAVKGGRNNTAMALASALLQREMNEQKVLEIMKE